MSPTRSHAALEPVHPPAQSPPVTSLVEGMRLDQPTFHALYGAAPPGFRAKLIDGVVRVMPSPIGYFHGPSHRSS
jgi:hypothetical protein